jgi:RNA polymerase sigma-70 factor, ECF subfamily
MKALAKRSKPKESKQAFRLLFDRHGGLVLGYCNRLLADRSLAEDVAQDVWMKVIHNAEKYEARNQLRPWLLTIARHTSLNILRSRKNWIELDQAQEIPSSDSEASLLETLVTKDRSAEIRNAIDELPALQRTAISLLTVEGLSYDEIAKAMGLGLGSVKTHIHRGRQTLTEKFNPRKGDVS